MFDKLLKKGHNIIGDLVGRERVDAAKVAVVKPLIQEKLTGIGELIDLKLDSDRKRMIIDLKLEGEEKPINVVVEKYKIERIDSQLYFIIQSVATTRAWLDAIAQKSLPLSLPIPERYANIVSILM